MHWEYITGHFHTLLTEKKLLNKTAFSLKSDINLCLKFSGGITGIFIDQPTGFRDDTKAIYFGESLKVITFFV